MLSDLQQTTAAVQPRAAETRRSPALDELPDLTGVGWKAVDVPPPPGGYAAFEPVAALPWWTQLSILNPLLDPFDPA